MKSKKSLLTQVTPAKGTRGTILLIPDEKPLFRVYHRSREYRREQMARQKAGERFDKKAWSHTDYEIEHIDFDVIIDEDFAVLHSRGNRSGVLKCPITPRELQSLAAQKNGPSAESRVSKEAGASDRRKRERGTVASPCDSV
jgi:hypothetical protein